MIVRTGRIGFVHAILALFALAVLARAAQVQLFQGKSWRERATRQQLAATEVLAPRGAVLDAAGLVLAQSREMVSLQVAPREVRPGDRGVLGAALRTLGVPAPARQRALDTSRVWVPIPGRYLVADAGPLLRIRGVHASATRERVYAMSDGTQRLVGRVDAAHHGAEGLELALDSILSGTSGSATFVRDMRGRSFESPTAPRVDARAGNTVVLALNHELQEIVEHALSEAVQSMGAEGGDIVVLDPSDGDILAMASRRTDRRMSAASALTEPFEPGSTLKPFIAAGLMARGKARPTDVVNTGNGTLELEGRVIHDEHRLGVASLAQVLQWSSNIGIVKFSQRFTPREEFEVLRDFGFGTPTGVPYPSEAGGTLRDPTRWSRQSAASLAMGYEIAVTPLQLAVAYATIANGGELLEPALVKEIRGPDGTVRFRHRKRVVRRVITPDVAASVRRMLLTVVDNGTALQADLSSYLLAGKTGTPRRTVNGRYAAQQYNPNFVGLFPGDAPQYVIVVKLVNPRDARGGYYGGSTAAPLTKTILQAAVAARDAALDRGQLAASATAARAARPETTVIARATPPVDSAAMRDSARAAARARARLVEQQGDRAEPTATTIVLGTRLPRDPPGAPRPVPDVRGLALRDAVRSLHAAGFHVALVRGPSGATAPAPGTMAAAGALIQLAFEDR